MAGRRTKGSAGVWGLERRKGPRAVLSPFLFVDYMSSYSVSRDTAAIPNPKVVQALGITSKLAVLFGGVRDGRPSTTPTISWLG
jgi:hypothetical protein